MGNLEIYFLKVIKGVELSFLIFLKCPKSQLILLLFSTPSRPQTLSGLLSSSQCLEISLHRSRVGGSCIHGMLGNIPRNTAAPCPQITPPLAIMMIIIKAEVGVCSKDVSISHKQFRVDNFIIVK